MIERFNLTARIWLWLERAADVRTAIAALPGIRCTLLRPGAWDAPLRATYFADAQKYGASAVSLQLGAIDAEVIAQAAAHDLLVFTRIDNDDTIGQLIRTGVGGVITDDPARTRQMVDLCTMT
ncbi:MAG: glycerophosphodiester phosphodiesterase [Thermomicrobiales bacterium]